MILFLTIIFTFLISGDGIKIHDAWVRPGAEKMGTALYFNIENNTNVADTLYKVTSDISNNIQIHETYQEGELSGMREVNKLIVEPNSSINLKPGSYHIMVMKLKKDILKGDKAVFTLYFSKNGEIKITAGAR